jgi:hypothetical protein
MSAPFVVAFLMTSLLMTRSVDAQEVLTNQSVVEMVKAGLSERVIIAKIRNSPTKFDTQTDALIALQKNGVPEKVIEAIMSPSAPAAAAAPPASSAPAGSEAMAPPPAAGPARPTVYPIVGGKEVELAAGVRAHDATRRDGARQARPR